LEDNKENKNNELEDNLTDQKSEDNSPDVDSSIESNKKSGKEVLSTDDKIDKDSSGLDESVSKHIKFVIGKKLGMTQIFNEDGVSYPCTIIDVQPNIITQIKTIKSDGYSSVQLGFGSCSKKNKSKAHIGKFESNNIPIQSVMKEFRVSDAAVSDLKIGLKVTSDVFNVGDEVDVSGRSIGKGFAGVMKRHGFGGGRRSHGKNSVMRKPGAIGASADPARVWPGKAMAGRMGGNNVTIKKLNILRIDNNKLFVGGSVPGSNNGIVFIKS